MDIAGPARRVPARRGDQHRRRHLAFAGFQLTVGQRWGYLAAMTCAHVVSVLIAFVLYRLVVFRVRGHVLADLRQSSGAGSPGVAPLRP
jgi:hypothetical protein